MDEVLARGTAVSRRNHLTTPATALVVEAREYAAQRAVKQGDAH
jgi:hypothetical protein